MKTSGDSRHSRPRSRLPSSGTLSRTESPPGGSDTLGQDDDGPTTTPRSNSSAGDARQDAEEVEISLREDRLRRALERLDAAVERGAGPKELLGLQEQCDLAFEAVEASIPF